jgi:DNA-binding transcriptional LysR family regulator
VETRELRVFAAVAEEGSLSAAARRLHLSQSALSQTIQSLERQLGVKLLVRSSTGVTVLLRAARPVMPGVPPTSFLRVSAEACCSWLPTCC